MHTNIKCSDGTLDPECSASKRMQCLNGTFVLNAEKCGCPTGYIEKGNKCVPVCSDGTEYGNCAKEKPKFCYNGNLINRSSYCGCPYEYTAQDENCVSIYKIDPKNVTFSYVLNGNWKSFSYTVFNGLNEYLYSLPRYITYSTSESPPTSEDFALQYLNNEKQEEFLNEFVNRIEKETNSEDDKVRIAISLVQNIPYDSLGVELENLKGKYPYEVLYTDKGVCSEKSELLAYIFREMGYGTALLLFNSENHEVVGIKCPTEYSYKNTGYCFIETTTPTIPTYSEGEYINVGKLYSIPEIIKISDGKSFNGIAEEYNDAKEYQEITNMGRILSSYYYSRWLMLSEKYGMQTS